jgi:hypothetical protein
VNVRFFNVENPYSTILLLGSDLKCLSKKKQKKIQCGNYHKYNIIENNYNWKLKLDEFWF